MDNLPFVITSSDTNNKKMVKIWSDKKSLGLLSKRASIMKNFDQLRFINLEIEGKIETTEKCD